MRSLIYAKSTDLQWLREFFPDVDPYLLKIVNKPLLEYSLDLVSLLGVSELRIVSDTSLKAIESYFKDGAKWGLKISYALARPNDTLESVYLKNYSFCKDDDVLFWDGFFFVQYDLRTVKTSFDLSQSFVCSSPERRLIFLRKGEKLITKNAEPETNASCLLIREIHSITDYYQLSMEILKERNQAYVLPGYSNEKDTFLGLNIIYPNSSTVKAPIMIGNNCRFRKLTVVGGNTIIGDNVIIDENTSVTDSIVYDNTYIGSDLDLDRKIVYKSHLISGLSGESIHITDRVLVSQVEKGIMISAFNRSMQRLIALLMLCVQLIPWLLLYLPFMLLYPKRKSERLLSRNLNTRYFEDPQLIANSPWGAFMLRLCLDKFCMLVKVVLGKLYLVGNHLFTNTVQHRKLVMDLPVYNPGAFSLAESVANENPDVELFYELEYIDNISTRFNLIILGRTLVRSLWYGRK